MSSSRTLLRKLRTSFTCIKPRFDPSIIVLYIAAPVEQYCDIAQVNALPENEGILEDCALASGSTFAIPPDQCGVMLEHQEPTRQLNQTAPLFPRARGWIQGR